MVSFFGLKRKGDKKKANIKQAQGQAPRKWNDQYTFNEGEGFYHDFSRPQFPSSSERPSTANSNRSISNWRSVFKNPGMTSSMVDLAPPTKRNSFGTLRHHASDMNLRSPAALPHPLGGNGLRPGTPSRPAGAKAEWVNPLAVHFCKDPSSSRPGTSSGPNYAATTALHAPTSPKNFLGNFDLGLSASRDGKETSGSNERGDTQKSDQLFNGQNGYPSPPQSEKDSEGPFSPISPPRHPKQDGNRPSSSRRNAPSALRNVDLNTAGTLPSPAPSVQRVSEDRPDGPVIRNVPARRDTMAFHQPLRKSVAMEFEGANRSATIPQPKEGFSGNFADFDFGEIVSKVSSTETRSANTSLDPLYPQSQSTTADTRDAANSIAESYESATTNREGSIRSSLHTRASEDQVGNSLLIDQLPRPPQDSAWRPSGPPPAAAGARLASGAIAHISPTQGFQSRFDSRTTTRAAPPRPLRPIEPLASVGNTEFSPKSPFGPPPDDGQSYMGGVRPPPRPNTDNAPSSPFSRPMQGDFPLTKGLPRGRRPEQPQPTTEKESSMPLPDWLSFDRSDPRRSAIPAPLSPLRSNTSPYSPAAWSGISTPTSATAPRLPSPTFPSLAKSISGSSDTFSKSFEVDFDAPMGSPTLGGFPSIDRRPSTSAGLSSRRVEAKKAPPRPAPVTLPPPSGREGGITPSSPAAGARSPMDMEIPGNFI